MATEPRWTLDELVRKVAAALSGSAYSGAPNGRIRDVPDRRAVRWYTTIGLVDRPAAMQGRTALYGTRHLLQVVAVKRRQTEGETLAEIQTELAGASDETLRRVANVPDELLAAEPLHVETAPPPRGRFWTERPRNDETVTPDDVDSVTNLGAVRLPGGVVLLLPRTPDDADASAIHAAARPLLDLLADLGLLEPGLPTLEERSTP